MVVRGGVAVINEWEWSLEGCGQCQGVWHLPAGARGHRRGVWSV